MSGFFIKALVNIDDAMGCTSMQEFVDYIGDRLGVDDSRLEAFNDLAELAKTPEGIQKLLHDPEHLPALLVLHDSMVDGIDGFILNEAGYIPDGNGYFLDEYKANEDIARSMILGCEDPEKLIAFAEGLQKDTVDAAKEMLKKAGLFGKTIDDALFAENPPESSGADDLATAFSFLRNQFSVQTGTCFFENCYPKLYPTNYDLEDVRKNPEKYAVIYLLFK